MVVNVMYIFGCHLGPLSVTESFAVCVCVGKDRQFQIGSGVSTSAHVNLC